GLLGILSDTGAATELVCYQRKDRALRPAFSIVGPGTGGPAVPVRRYPHAGRHPRGHLALSLFRTRNRPSSDSERGGMVPTAPGTACFPGTRDGSIRRIAGPPRLLGI